MHRKIGSSRTCFAARRRCGIDRERSQCVSGEGHRVRPTDHREGRCAKPRRTLTDKVPARGRYKAPAPNLLVTMATPHRGSGGEGHRRRAAMSRRPETFRFMKQLRCSSRLSGLLSPQNNEVRVGAVVVMPYNNRLERARSSAVPCAEGGAWASPAPPRRRKSHQLAAQARR